MPSIADRFQSLLTEREQQHLYRRRPLSFSPQQNQMQINGVQTINFSSNDYLGFANHPEIKKAVIEALQSEEISYGSGAAHLVTGHHLHHHILEDEIADWLHTERALLFSTGYMANLAVQQALLQKGDVIIADKLNHASLIDGAQLSEAEVKRYPHNDMQALERRLQQAQKQQSQAMIVTDGVFSMDGVMAQLPKIQQLAKQYKAWLFIDDAHGIGALGKSGGGIFDYYNIKPDSNTIIVGTLGKAFGTSGAFVAASQVTIEALIQFARPYIYTTAMPQSNAVAIRSALKLVQNGQASRETLQQHIELFKNGVEKIGLQLIPSDTAIQPIILGDSQTALNWSKKLAELGFWVTAIRPPTVPNNQARLRISLSAAHRAEDINALLNALQKCQESITIS